MRYRKPHHIVKLVFAASHTNHADCLLYFFTVLRIRSRFLISLLSSLLNHGRSLLRIVTSFQREVWLYERTDNEKIASKLDTVDWNALLSDSQDVDEMCNTLFFSDLF
jgi:hypothetical protein